MAHQDLGHTESLTGLLRGILTDFRTLIREEIYRMNTVTFVEGDACAMPLPDASFDVVIALECAFHFPDRR